MEKKRKKPELSSKSERIVVDEVFDSGLARILRSKRMDGYKQSDYTIDAWGKEREDFIADWRVEAFVGFLGGRKIREGDVFFIVDGSAFNNKYDPIKRDEARKKHLLMPVEKSIEIARTEIKEEFHKLSAFQISSDKKHDMDSLIRQIEKNMAIELKNRRKRI